MIYLKLRKKKKIQMKLMNHLIKNIKKLQKYLKILMEIIYFMIYMINIVKMIQIKKKIIKIQMIHMEVNMKIMLKEL